MTSIRCSASKLHSVTTRLTARMCSLLVRPRGILLWLPGYEDSLVSGIPLEEMDEVVPSQLAGRRAKGIRILGEVANLEPAENVMDCSFVQMAMLEALKVTLRMTRFRMSSSGPAG